MERLQLLENWIRTQFPDKSYTLSPASADASFRRYFRATFSDGTLIAMDAPPQQEDCAPFVHVAELFAAAGAHVPAVLARDLAQGFLLLSDLGSTTYLQALSSDPDSADRLYRDAVAALLKIQLASRPDMLPEYDEALLRRELDLFPDWYVAKHLQIALGASQKALLDTIFQQIMRNNLAQARVFVHRDYHSRNLMVTTPNPGILDFQDAVYGPITYDLASLFKDAYIFWDEERILDWIIRYWEEARKAGLPVAADFADFYRDFEWMGVQRHIKVLGIFARLYHRDGKAGYLRDMPLVMAYLRKACERYRELNPLLTLLDGLENKPPEAKVGYTF
ncbi:aminoglycoside phosphotransferase family protein [Nitrosospira sp. NpAV]|uniref:aminoglycoside phosphotransferase family protein n=1 Tax=Nitrosospira sp. NpAV TaxID=58133 RepID=UPI00059EE9CC|nr:phosphotransferase [Nitrosospira sp. NpAV]KIO49572.1 aminoglycoside phosphotransferase [Nitrosospira sp. NpAV]